MLLAKNAHIHRLLNDIHTRGQLHKIYHGLVYGAPPEPEGTIDMPIGRCPKPSLLRRIDPLCQPARTRYRLLEQGPAWSLLELEPLTGRTHQLRVHCAFLGCPMLGDPSTEPRPVKPSPPAWAFPISSSAPGSFTSPTP